MTSEILNTQGLVQRIQAGDRAAMEELSRRYLTRVLSAVRIRLGAHLRKKVESWDLVQEAMCDAFRHIDAFEFRTEGAFLKYVNRIVENRIRDEADRWRAQKRAMDKEVPLGAGQNDSVGPRQVQDPLAGTPSQLVALREDLERLEQALDQLDADDRELVIAVKLEGQSYQEIARGLDLTPDAVRMRVNRALSRVARFFENSS